MEYRPELTADATAPVTPVVSQQASTVEDLERRLAVLKAAGVREYVDAGIHILFERPAQKREVDPITELIAKAEAERIAAGG